VRAARLHEKAAALQEAWRPFFSRRTTVLLQHLYRVSLEEPHCWAMWVGLPVDSIQMLDVRIDHLRSYIFGLQEAIRLSGDAGSDLAEFFEWLRVDKQEFPCEGWARKCLRDCSGDHIRAISRFWGFLHEYLLLTRPEWFVRLNAEPLASEIRNGLGEARRVDIRIIGHRTP